MRFFLLLSLRFYAQTDRINELPVLKLTEDDVGCSFVYESYFLGFKKPTVSSSLRWSLLQYILVPEISLSSQKRVS